LIGISLHAGVSRGAGGRLRSPAVDARDLAAAAAARGFGVQRVLIDPTADDFVRELALAVSRSHRGSTLLLTFSGHGREHSWCFFDCDLPLSAVCRELAPLPRGTYVCIVADACHPESWREVDVPLRAEVMVVAPPECHPRDGQGINTRSVFTAALIRALCGGTPISDVIPLTPVSSCFEPFTVVAAIRPRAGGRSCSDRGARRTR
jgi:hypothetical protein